jgi:hypothetical protein
MQKSLIVARKRKADIILIAYAGSMADIGGDLRHVAFGNHWDV